MADCLRPARALGYCTLHYERKRTHGDPTIVFPHRPLAERFWPKVVKSDGCWLWVGAKFERGYGCIVAGGPRINGRPAERRHLYAHRVSYELSVGPIPDGLYVCHHCDNPPCVNPSHLFLGTATDNNRDREAKGRGRYTVARKRAADARQFDAVPDRGRD
jgi:hypothetical protein